MGAASVDGLDHNIGPQTISVVKRLDQVLQAELAQAIERDVDPILTAFPKLPLARPTGREQFLRAQRDAPCDPA